MPDYAQSMDHAMEELGIPRAHVIGNSVGGLVALELAASYPDRVERLVLMGAPVWDPRAASQRLKAMAGYFDEKGLSLPATMEALKANNTFTDPRPEWVAKANELRAQNGVWFGRIIESLLYYDVISRLHHVRATATLVLNGELDANHRVDEDVLVYNIPNASKIILPGLGHWPQVEDPEAFLAPVLEFLK